MYIVRGEIDQISTNTSRYTICCAANVCISVYTLIGARVAPLRKGIFCCRCPACPDGRVPMVPIVDKADCKTFAFRWEKKTCMAIVQISHKFSRLDSLHSWYCNKLFQYNLLQGDGHTRHQMSLLRPGVIKQHKTKPTQTSKENCAYAHAAAAGYNLQFS